ncbi:Teichoic acids export ATP-binding protein TagH [Anaerolineae bacterium]|nr:Teichoic acids export ATP-binding protein TagH [Anaerolineae bacterium]
MTIPPIQFNQVSKQYRLGKGFASLRGILADRNRKDSHPEQYHWAVKKVSFQVQPGEALGIIGPNGAGKTTILKILSRVTSPTSGEMRVNGRLSALIELGAGFHQDLTGRENIFLNGTILGMRTSEVKARFDQIVDFAGIGKFLDTPVKRYSSGMYARLGFAIAAHVDPQILLVDEVLAVGDYAFQMKCYARMKELRAKGTALIFVSHNLEAVRQVCDRGLVMYRGEAIYQGPSSEAVVAYSNAIRQSAREAQLAAPTEDGLSQLVMTFDAEIMNVSLLDATGQTANVIKSGDLATIAMDVMFHKDVSQPIFSLNIRTPDGRLVYDTTTLWLNIQTPNFCVNERCRVEFVMKLPLLDGEYQIDVDVADSKLSHYYDRLEGALGFWVKSDNSAKGLVDLKAEARITRLAFEEGQHELAKS